MVKGGIKVTGLKNKTATGMNSYTTFTVEQNCKGSQSDKKCFMKFQTVSVKIKLLIFTYDDNALNCF